MITLGIETSCDETSAAVVEDTGDPVRPWRVRSNVVASQEDIHREWGGVVPELSARQHIRDICGVVERTLLEWRQRFVLRQVLFDPFQMAAVSQRLAKAHVPIEEYPQSVPNLTAATSNLFDLIQSRGIALYPDAAMRLAVSRAIIVESSRDWRLDKLKQQHKIDVVVALSMACLAAVRGQGKPSYDLFAPGLFDD